MSLAKKLKLIVKGEPKPTFGTDPKDPWSVRAGITESEQSMLNAYLKSRGINPEFVSKDTKISHAKSSEFNKWKRDHMFDDPADTVSSVVRDKMMAQREEVEIEEGKTLKLTPVQARQKALSRSEKLTNVVKHDGLHQESVDKEDTITFDIPLLIRVLEYAREDAKTDMDLHKVTEKLISIRDKGTLTMADYDFIVKLKEDIQFDEAKTIQGTALDRFRQAALEREKKHNAIEKARQEKLHQDPSKVTVPEPKAKDGMSAAIDRLEKHLNKEEVEQIDELKKSTVKSWLGQQSVVPPKKPGMDRKAHNQRIKTRSKSWDRALDRLTGAKPTSEDVYQDSQAATQTPCDCGTTPNQTEPTYSRRKEMSKSARMIKALYKKNKMVKEELYDHEKEDKSVATYGKKPKVQKLEDYSDKEDQAAMVLKGGKTLTGQTRDTLEIDPVMRKANKNNDNKTNK